MDLDIILFVAFTQERVNPEIHPLCRPTVESVKNMIS